MKRIITLATGFAVGYVVGAKAGRERYEQIQQKMHDLSRQPAVTEARESLRHGVDTASKTVADKIAHVTSGLSHSSSEEHSSNGASPDVYSAGGRST
ncbi:MAG: hypothetical protein AUG49_14460 [Catenulispora sp. 13_1_20CM_3_70_7]|jgi:hypothetical protein|nr:MAG: hypothetical protein AUG49_14460 [Catenulispora sp. 13_1_20CM_3_70_7]